MTAVGFLHRIHCQGTNGVDAELFQLLVVSGLILGSPTGWMLLFPDRNVYLATHPLPPF